MAKWEYKTIILNRTGTHEDFSFKWTYGPWEAFGVGQIGGLTLDAGLEAMGRDGWELVGVVPTDVWVEGTRAANASHGERTISYTLFFKRQVEEAG